jgi:Putative sensor
MTTAVAVRENPLRTVAGSAPWRSAAYLLSYLVVGPALFGGVLVVLVVTLVLNISWLGLPLLVGAAAIVRGAAHLERRRATVVGVAIEPTARPVSGPGLLKRARAAWRGPHTWRLVGYLVLLFPLLYLLDLTVAVAWVAALAGITLPVWFWSVSVDLPGGSRAHGVWLGYPVDSLPVALLTAVGFVVLAAALVYPVIGAARLHAAVARSLLGPRVDPLAEAKRMLAEPGPLLTR